MTGAYTDDLTFGGEKNEFEKDQYLEEEKEKKNVIGCCLGSADIFHVKP